MYIYKVYTYVICIYIRYIHIAYIQITNIYIYILYTFFCIHTHIYIYSFKYVIFHLSLISPPNIKHSIHDPKYVVSSPTKAWFRLGCFFMTSSR